MRGYVAPQERRFYRTRAGQIAFVRSVSGRSAERAIGEVREHGKPPREREWNHIGEFLHTNNDQHPDDLVEDLGPELNGRREEAIKACRYRNGDLHLGGMAAAHIVNMLGGQYGRDSLDDLINRATEGQLDELYAYQGFKWILGHYRNNPPTPESDHATCLRALKDAQAWRPRSDERCESPPPEIEEIVGSVECGDFEFMVRMDGDRPYLQVQCDDTCNNTGEPYRWHGRKWLLSPHMTKSEVVQTCLAAAQMAQEHELRENFKYRGEPIFRPHWDVDALVALSNAGATEHRDSV